MHFLDIVVFAEFCLVATLVTGISTVVVNRTQPLLVVVDILCAGEGFNVLGLAQQARRAQRGLGWRRVQTEKWIQLTLKLFWGVGK